MQYIITLAGHAKEDGSLTSASLGMALNEYAGFEINDARISFIDSFLREIDIISSDIRSVAVTHGVSLTQDITMLDDSSDKILKLNIGELELGFDGNFAINFLYSSYQWRRFFQNKWEKILQGKVAGK